MKRKFTFGLRYIKKGMISKLNEIIESIMKKNFKFNTDVKILVITDDSTKRLGTTFFNSLKELGWDSELNIMSDRKKSGEEPTPEIAKNILKYKIVFCLTRHSLTHTVARKKANEKGISFITMPGITEDMFINGAINANYEKVEEKTLKMSEKLTNHTKIIIKTKDNKLTIPIGDRISLSSTGVFHKLGDSGNLPSGEAYVAPLEYQANGDIEINGSISGIGLLNSPIKLTIEKGRLIAATGVKGDELLKILGDGEGRILAEFGIGTNFAARITGNILEDEKANNTIHIAFGSNHTFGGVVKTDVHIDCVTQSPQLEWIV